MISKNERPFALAASSRLAAITIAALACTWTSGACAAPVAPEGIWYTKDEESIIKVRRCPDTAEAFCGNIVWLKEPKEADGSPKLDKLNKDPAKRNRPIVGLQILVDMTADSDHWAGKAYNPEDGKLYDITFKVKTDKEENDQADLRGCILRFLCQTETFTRAKDVPGGEPKLSDATPTKKRKGAKKDKDATVK